MSQEVETVNEVTVLVIDEHDSVRALLSRGLGGSSPLRVIAATGSPLEGMELAEAWSPDVILADLKRRGRYSTEMYGRIGRSSPASRLVVYSSYLSPEEEAAAREAGACVCLLKGMSLKELADRLVEIAAEHRRVNSRTPV